ncbi:hypothetical protein [Marinicellulosiphila megalodicopiae]|uniref:hypothetical protein n=1 Tax=Marinicellulosiphila megalodicopiae TaxID=2724896 RepID=UPI003BAE9779
MKKIITVSIMCLLATACSTSSTKSTSVKSATTTSSTPSSTSSVSDETREKRIAVFDCFMQWDYMLYGYALKKEGFSQSDTEQYFINEIEKNSESNVASPLSDSIRKGVKYIFKNGDEEQAIYAITESIRSGFNSCLVTNKIEKNRDIQLALDIAENVTIVTIAKNKGLSQSDMINILGENNVFVSSGMIEKIYKEDDFNAGTFRLGIWRSTISKVK